MISITTPQRDGHAEITGNTLPINPNIPRIISRLYMKVQFIFLIYVEEVNFSQLSNTQGSFEGSLNITLPQYNGSVVAVAVVGTKCINCIILRHPAALCRRELHNCVH